MIQAYRLLQDDDAAEEGITVTDIVLAIGIFFLMFGVGMSCKVDLVKKVIRSPKALKAALAGLFCQWLFMPAIAYLLILVFRIDNDYAALGVLFTGCVPGSGSSNMFTIWGRGVLELSVFMTILSTVLAFGLTPFWLWLFSNTLDSVTVANFAFADMLITFGLMVIPLLLGFSVNFCSCRKKLNIEVPLSVFAVVLFCATIVLIGIDYADAVTTFLTWELAVSASIFFPITAGVSWTFLSLLKLKPSVKRTVVMEIGIQNLALGLAIATQTLKTKTQRNLAFSFPWVYAIAMYSWCFAVVPLMRWQKRRNEEKGIEDSDADFFVEGDDTDEAPAQAGSEKPSPA